MPTRKTPSTRKTAAKSKSTKPSASKTKTVSKKKPASKTTKKKTASPKKKTPVKKTPVKRKKKTTQAAEAEVTIDRRNDDDRREEVEAEAPAGPKLERREKVTRRRQIDPTTCERDYSDQEVAFMSALDEYKRKNGRMFPTCSEVLEVIRDLGYVQLSTAELAARAPVEAPQAEISEWSPEEEEVEADAELVG